MIALGALANSLAAWGRAREESAVYGFADFLISLGVSGFAGAMFGLGANYFTSDPTVIYGVAGGGAYLGVAGLNRLTDVLLSTLESRVRGSNGD